MSQLVAPKLNIPSLGHSPSGGSASGLGFSPGSSALSGIGGGRGLGLAPSLGTDTTQRLIAELHMNKQGPTPTSGALGSYRSSNSGLGVRSMLDSPRRATSPTNVSGFTRLFDDKTTLAASSSMPQFRRAEDVMSLGSSTAPVQAARTMSSSDSTSSDEYEMLTAEGLARAHGGVFTAGEVGNVMPPLSLDRSSLSGSSVSSDLSGSASASRAQAAAQLAKAKASYEQAKQPEASMMGVSFGTSQHGSSRPVDLTVAHADLFESEANLQADSPSRSRIRSSLPSNIGASMRTRDPSDGLRFSEGMVNVDLMADQPLGQDLIRASSSTSLPPRASSKGSVTGSSVGAGVLVNDSSENLTQALTAFGAPSEWYHDSIILGRLSALALRYFHAKASRKPWQAWRAFTRSERNRKRNFLRNLESACRRVAFRKFRFQVLATDDRTDDRNRIIGKARWIPLLNVLTNLPVILLRPTWTRLRQAIFMRRDLHRRLRLLTLINSKMKQMLARTHYYEHLQRQALGAFWLAKEVRINSRFSRDTVPRRSLGSTSVATAATVHVAQVLRRSWRRWFYGVRLWMSSAEYAVRETELWLTGEISTPRDIVTNTVMQVVSPETHLSNNGLSDNFLGYGGAWNLGRASIASFPEKRSHFKDSRPRYDGTPYQEQEDQLLLPFPHVDFDSRKDNDRHTPRVGSEAGDSATRRYRDHRKTSPLPVDSSSRSHYESLIASFRSKVQSTTKPRRKGDEDSVTVPPTRQRRSIVFEQTKQAALENEIDRSRREYEEEQSRMMEYPLDNDIGEQSRRSPRHHSRNSPNRDEEARAAQRRDRRHSSSMGHFSSELVETYSDDDMAFVDGRRHIEGQSTKSSPFYDQGSYDLSQDPANDYWALRNRRGPAATRKEISLRRA